MLYMTCPTCGYFLGQITTQYEEAKESICSNPDLSQEKKEEELQKVLLSLKLRRYCCKMRVMTFKDLSRDIIPVVN